MFNKISKKIIDLTPIVKHQQGGANGWFTFKNNVEKLHFTISIPFTYEEIITSSIIKRSYHSGKELVETQNSIYIVPGGLHTISEK